MSDTTNITVSSGDSTTVYQTGSDVINVTTGSGDTTNVTLYDFSGGVNNDHANLLHLDYPSSGHTGFENYFVPYTGAVSDVDIGAHSFFATKVGINTSDPSKGQLNVKSVGSTTVTLSAVGVTDITAALDENYLSSYTPGDQLIYQVYFYSQTYGGKIYSAGPQNIYYTVDDFANSVLITVNNLHGYDGMRILRCINGFVIGDGIDITATGEYWDDNGYSGTFIAWDALITTATPSSATFNLPPAYLSNGPTVLENGGVYTALGGQFNEFGQTTPTTPTNPLKINFTNSGATDGSLVLNNVAGAQSVFQYSFAGTPYAQTRVDSGGNYVFATKGSQFFGYQTDFGDLSDMYFGVDSSFTNPAFFIKGSTRYTGFGTTAPTYKVDVRGTVANDKINNEMGINFTQVTAPTTASTPTFAVALLSGGSALGIGTYYYGVSYLTAAGETETYGGAKQVSGGVSKLTIITDASNRKVRITLPVSTDPRVTGRRIYRSNVNGQTYNDRTVTTINDNTTTTYDDNIADASLTGTTPAGYYRPNSTNQFMSLNGIPFASCDYSATIFGYNAGRNVTGTNGQNTFFGMNAGTGYGTNGAGFNSFFGDSAGALITYGNANVAIGAGAGYFLRVGGANTAVGYQSNFQSQGSGNTTFGYRAMFGTDNTANYNSVFGYQAAYAITTGGHNIIYGYKAGDALTTGGYNIIIGDDIDMPAVSSSNMLNIGNVIFGTSFDGTGTTIPASSKVGIKTATPSAALEVVDPNFPVIKGTRTSAATNTNLASFGIKHKTSNNMVDSFGSSVAFMIEDDAAVENIIAAFGAIRDGADNSGKLVFSTRSSGSQTDQMFITAAGNILIGGTGTAVGRKLEVTGTTLLQGNVQIGSSSSSANLDIHSSVFPVMRSTRYTTGTTGQYAAFVAQAVSTGDMADTFGSGLYFSIQDTAATENLIAGIAAARDGADNSGRLVFSTRYAGSSSDWVFINAVGNVGIRTGTTPPNAELQVVGRITEQGTMAEIYVADSAVAQSIPTGTTYTKLTSFDTNGVAVNATADQANDKITITKAGKYLVNYTSSYASGTNNVEFKTALFYDGAEQSNCHYHTKVGVASDKVTSSFTGIITAAANKDIDVRTRHDNGGSVNITVDYANLNITYLGE
jgi:hypothetical protein